MARFDAKRTEVAQNAFNFAQYFTSSFEHVRLGGGVPRKPAVVAPEGMSTGGGKAARQSICLVAEAPGVPVLTVGWVDLVSLSSMLRSYRCLAGMHAARYRGRTLDLDRAEYERFFAQAKELLSAMGLQTIIEDDVGAVSTVPSTRPPAASSPRAQADRSVETMSYAAAVFVGFAVGAIVGGLAVYARFVGF
ncbi:MAG TPA: hypothetical protein VL400_08955 [Polyangiaceae bacterium]|nr:hypothetical protein [Polyangiaceae bacterium]